MTACILSCAFHVEVATPDQKSRSGWRQSVATFLARQIPECDHRIEQSAGRRFVGVGFGGNFRWGCFASMNYRKRVELHCRPYRQRAPPAHKRSCAIGTGEGIFFVLGTGVTSILDLQKIGPHDGIAKQPRQFGPLSRQLRCQCLPARRWHLCHARTAPPMQCLKRRQGARRAEFL
jgi:hypothetical protein